MDGLVDAGVIVLGGPLADEMRVVHVVEAASEAAIRDIFARDPWSGSHLVIDTIEPWTIRLDGRRRTTIDQTETSMTAADAIREAMLALGGEVSIRQVKDWIDTRYPGRWKDISTAIADLTYPGNQSSTYSMGQRFLVRTARGRYRLRRASD
jgi:hypothetical protein